MGQKANARKLRTMFKTAGIDVDLWGTGTTKSFQHLCGLIKNREVAIEELPTGKYCILSRKLKMTVLAEFNGGWHRLYERCRLFPDGSHAFDISGTSISEKLLIDESGDSDELLVKIAIRALEEELGLQITSENMPDFLPGSKYDAQPHNSCSYPGLLARGPRIGLTCILTHPSHINEMGYREPGNVAERAIGLFGWKKSTRRVDPRTQARPLHDAHVTGRVAE